MTMKQKPQLGKGMAALLGGSPSMHTKIEPQKSDERTIDSQPLLVPIEKIIPNRNQPRKIFKEKELLELAESIKENGIIQPLIVTQNETGSFDLVAGERRLKASKLAGLERVPVVIKRATKKEHMVMSIIENVQRADLNCIEEALAYFQLMNEFGLTQEEVAKKVGKERSTVANFLRILKLPKDIIMMLNKELLSFGHAKVLAAVGDDETAKRLANEVVAKNLSVRELEELTKANSKKKTKSKDDSAVVLEHYTQLRDRLEKKTGFHFALKAKKNGAGQITIKFSNEAEFNDIFGYLMK